MRLVGALGDWLRYWRCPSVVKRRRYRALGALDRTSAVAAAADFRTNNRNSTGVRKQGS